MIHEDVLKVLGDIAAADGPSYGIVGALTVIVFVVMRTMLPVKSLACVFAPVIFWGGLAGIYAASTWGFAVGTDKAANTVATAGLGMIAALVVMVVLTRLAEAAMRIRAPLAAPVSTDAQRRVRI